MLSNLFHPVVAGWFEERFSEPTEAQRLSWPQIVAGEHTLVAAPTGSGKTFAAFLVAIDRLLRQAVDKNLPDEIQVVYVSPLKALSNDIRRNLQAPLEEIQAVAAAAGLDCDSVRVAVRTGDTPPGERQAMLRKPPHILVTTPESLYLLLTGAKSREMLRSVRTVIVDEIHALARDKRGSHLTLSLARLDRLCATPPVRIGLSATQRPMDQIACFLVGTPNVDADGRARCNIIDTGHVRQLDLAVEVPPSELSAVCSHETWKEVYSRLSDLIREHRSTLVFVNTRRLAERVCHYLEEELGPGPRCQPSRQPVARDAAACRRAAQSGRTESDRGHGVARAGYRHRLHRPRLPNRFAAIDCYVFATGWPRGPCARPHPQGPAVRHDARRAARSAGAGARGA